MKTYHSNRGPLKFHFLVWGLFLAMALLSCKTRSVANDESKTKQELKTEDKNTSQSISESESKSSTVAEDKKQNNIISESEDVEVIEEFNPPDSAGKQSLKSRTTRKRKAKQEDKSLIHNTVIGHAVSKAIDTYKTEQQKTQQRNIKERTQNKSSQSNSTIAANLPWYVWLILTIGILIFLIFKYR